MLRLSVFVCFLALTNAYVYKCLDDCECDTEDEVIHCQEGERTELILPEGSRLRGFYIIALPYNNIKRLPDEKTLLQKFPDLQVIDIERNPFDCDTHLNYRKVQVISDCNKNVTEVRRVPPILDATDDCDLACQAEKHYKKLHEYVLQLWQIIQEKYENFDLDQTLKQIQEFFKNVVVKVNAIHQDIKDRMENSNREHPKQITPLPTLKDISEELD